MGVVTAVTCCLTFFSDYYPISIVIKYSYYQCNSGVSHLCCKETDKKFKTNDTSRVLKSLFLVIVIFGKNVIYFPKISHKSFLWTITSILENYKGRLIGIRDYLITLVESYQTWKNLVLIWVWTLWEPMSGMMSMYIVRLTLNRSDSISKKHLSPKAQTINRFSITKVHAIN